MDWTTLIKNPNRFLSSSSSVPPQQGSPRHSPQGSAAVATAIAAAVNPAVAAAADAGNMADKETNTE